jgi:rubrerythrin
MKIIRDLSEMIEEELEGAEEYIEMAIRHKEENPSMAAVFYEISVQEMNHVNMLHDEVTKVIKKYREKHGDPPPEMQAVYDWEHKKQIERTKEVKVLQNHYRGV